VDIILAALGLGMLAAVASQAYFSLRPDRLQALLSRLTADPSTKRAV